MNAASISMKGGMARRAITHRLQAHHTHLTPRGVATESAQPNGSCGGGRELRRRTGIEPASAAARRSPVLKTGGPTRYPDASATTLLRAVRVTASGGAGPAGT